VRTGRKVDTETILELAHTVPNLVGLKDAAGSPGETAKLVARAPDGFEVYSGDDGLTLPLLAIGAVGVVGVATHWSGTEHQAMIAAFQRGDVAEARRIHQLLLPSFAYESTLEAPNPIPSKVMMRVLGIDVGEGRPPMDGAPVGLDLRARAVLTGLALGAR
jgi:4-hydroxy-tetrahydrodipicolinate synthase